MSFFKKFFTREKEEDLNKGLEKTKESFFSQVTKAIAGKSTVDEEFLDDLEQILISADVGLNTTVKIIDRLEARVARDKYLNTAGLNEILRDEISDILAENHTEDLEDFLLPEGHKPHIVLVVGVNGVGKTTTIGKLSHQFKKKGKAVVLGAGDTFRAAASDQLKIWAERSGAHFFTKGMNVDPASVAYEAVNYAIHENMDLAIIDTAGRLHTKKHLMDELTKIRKSIDKRMPGAPHETILVLDATTGQNAIEQARRFTEATEVTGIALTKLDGSAKGGVVLGISDQFKIPIRYIAVGEGIEQLQVFNRKAFVDSLFR
ncbi:MAG: signal recognition particle-docking protein FtsY [Saprospiraceae bacterium]|nr:signal recognition particle-docking protein FtsY [Saprospiraceae bacterium]